ncbi:F0F1 ATP synthase subunit B [Bogoriella caseilytica]|uniref:ATP synthase subunit b n=1 Tax=Bogoriella caseilytica TaxID=56055 RepID=A0A3N2BEX4_9MICO|nr:F0F1 ATP synthase subunit B [Bogoriella caseilytica]ROR73792.1 ATP synthase F0 subcomplex B subunit [Bogoriella caseilytica]
MSSEVHASSQYEGWQLLIPPFYDVLWSAVALVIIVGVLWKSLPKIQATLDERAEKIEGGLREAERAREEAKLADERMQRELGEARRESAQTRERAQEEAKQIVAEARANAQAEAERVLAAADRQIEAERQQAQISLRADVGMLATELASRIVGESVKDQALQSRVIDRFLDDLEAEQSGSGATVGGSAGTTGQEA